MSCSVDATVRPSYGSRCAATESPCARAAAITCGSRLSSSDPRPHQETITVADRLPRRSRASARRARARRPRSRGRAPGRSPTRGRPAARCRPAASARSAPSVLRRGEPGVVEDPHPGGRRRARSVPAAFGHATAGKTRHAQVNRTTSRRTFKRADRTPRIGRLLPNRRPRCSGHHLAGGAAFQSVRRGERARPEEVRPSSNTIVDPGTARERAWTARAARSLDAPTQHSTTTRGPLETRRETDQERHPARRATILLIREGFPGHSIPRTAGDDSSRMVKARQVAPRAYAFESLSSRR